MSVVIRLKVPIEMHYTVIAMGTSKVNSSRYLSLSRGVGQESGPEPPDHHLFTRR